MSKKYRVECVSSVRLQVATRLFNRNYATVLYSYGTPVAIYSEMQVFLLPKYDYSVTTMKHLHKFIKQHCEFCRDYPIAEIRKIAAKRGFDGEYIFADLIYIMEGDICCSK